MVEVVWLVGDEFRPSTFMNPGFKRVRVPGTKKINLSTFACTNSNVGECIYAMLVTPYVALYSVFIRPVPIVVLLLIIA